MKLIRITACFVAIFSGFLSAPILQAEEVIEKGLTENFETIAPDLPGWAAVKGDPNGDVEQWRPAAKWDEFLTVTLVAGEGVQGSKCLKVAPLQDLVQLQIWFSAIKVPAGAKKLHWKFSAHGSGKVPEGVVQFQPRDGESNYMRKLVLPGTPLRMGRAFKEFKGEINLDPGITTIGVILRFPEVRAGADIFVDDYSLEFQ